jgi:hypothetical protein
MLRLECQGALRAEGGASTAVTTGQIGRIAATEKGDNRIQAPSGRRQEVVTSFLSADLNALAVNHAERWIVRNKVPCPMGNRHRLHDSGPCVIGVLIHHSGHRVDERERADRNLRAYVATKGYPVVARMMYYGVRKGRD